MNFQSGCVNSENKFIFTWALSKYAKIDLIAILIKIIHVKVSTFFYVLRHFHELISRVMHFSNMAYNWVETLMLTSIFAKCAKIRTELNLHQTLTLLRLRFVLFNVKIFGWLPLVDQKLEFLKQILHLSGKDRSLSPNS